MKKSVYAIVLAVLCIVSFSCKKQYHCTCTFNNKIVYTEDLGLGFEKNAQDKCSSYDTTVTGEVWNCKIY